MKVVSLRKDLEHSQNEVGRGERGAHVHIM